MKFRNTFMKYYSAAGEGGAGDGGQPGAAGGEDKDDVVALKAELEALRGHHDKLLSETKAAKAKAKEEAETARLAAEEVARKSGDVAALDKSWQEKHAKASADFEAALSAANNQLQSVLVDSVASRAAMEIAVDADCAELLADKMRSRIKLIDEDGKKRTVILDADGNRSALTIEDLKTELSDKYRKLVKGSLASGAGGQSQTAGGASGSSNSGDMLERARQIIKAKG